MRPKKLKIFSCPEGCKKKYISLMALNNHITKVHKNVSYKIDLISQGRARAKSKIVIKRTKYKV